jgi:hypothetical protein
MNKKRLMSSAILPDSFIFVYIAGWSFQLKYATVSPAA